MLEGILIIAVVGFLAGELAGKMGLPKLIGMLLIGIIIGPYALGLLPQEILNFSEEIRMFTLLIILFKAGLGLDKEKIMAQGSVAVRMGFLPALAETAVVAIAARLILGWSWPISWLLGWIICAASPAVVVPMILKLKSEGWGVKKGIPDLALAGGAASDAVAVTMFGIFLSLVTGELGENLWVQVANIPIQIILGIIVGLLAGLLVRYILRETYLSDNVIHDIIIGLGIALLLLIGENYLPYSEFLAIMVMGFVILEKDAVLARRIRTEIDKIWVIGEIFLFVLIGAAVNIEVMLDAGFVGLLIIAIGLIIGRTIGMYASTWGSILNSNERKFVVVGQMAKATVQAAIGGIPLAMGVQHGEYILAISVLSILATAPLGAFAISSLAPKWLEKGKVDPTKITVEEDYKFLVAMDGSDLASEALVEASRVARQVDAKLIIVNVHSSNDDALSKKQLEKELEVARDLEHEIIFTDGRPSQAIMEIAQKYKTDFIFMGKRGKNNIVEKVELGGTAETILRYSDIPATLIGENGV